MSLRKPENLSHVRISSAANILIFTDNSQVFIGAENRLFDLGGVYQTDDGTHQESILPSNQISCPYAAIYCDGRGYMRPLQTSTDVQAHYSSTTLVLTYDDAMNTSLAPFKKRIEQHRLVATRFVEFKESVTALSQITPETLTPQMMEKMQDLRQLADQALHG